jgi:nitric oxide dioxygenase
MSPEQVKLIQDSFAEVAPIADTAAEIFYDRLFVLAPQVRALFPDDMTEQRRKLMATLAVVVNGLSHLDTVLPAASALARRHVAYGAQPAHYPIVGEALLWTLARALGRDWTPDVAKAWTGAYATLSEFMIGEAYGQPKDAHTPGAGHATATPAA